MWVGSLVWEDPLEKEMATHSSILWKIQWTEEPGGLQSMGVTKSQTQLSTHAHTHTHTQTYQVPLEPRVSEQRGGRVGELLPTKPRATLILRLMRAGQRGAVAATETRGQELKGRAALVLLSVLSLAYSKGPVCASAHPPCLWWPWVIC